MRWVATTIAVIAALSAVLMLQGPDAAPIPAPATLTTSAGNDAASPGRQSRAAAEPTVDADTPFPPALDASHASEPQLMREARALLERDPEHALALIEAADQRFGGEHEARRVLEIEALVKLERIGLSHARAEHFYRRFPDSAEKRRIEQLTGYHPRPWGPSK